MMIYRQKNAIFHTGFGWQGIWHAGQQQRLPGVVFQARIVGYEFVPISLGLSLHEKPLNLVVDAVSRDERGFVAAQVTLRNRESRSLQITSLNISIDRLKGDLDASTVSVLRPGDETSFALELRNDELLPTRSNFARAFGYGGPISSDSFEMTARWSYKIGGRDHHENQSTTFKLRASETAAQAQAYRESRFSPASPIRVPTVERRQKRCRDTNHEFPRIVSRMDRTGMTRGV